jgi:hypothetical protein
MTRWKPEWAESYRRGANDEGNGVVTWDGRRLDGWEEAGRLVEFAATQKCRRLNVNELSPIFYK